METLGNQIMPKLCPNYACIICDYTTSKKSSFDKHVLSAKHQKRTKGNVLESFGNQIMPKLCSAKYTCEKCNKEFKNRSGLWKHRTKVCKIVENTPEIKSLNEPTDKELIMLLIKENSELKNIMVEQQNLIMEVIKTGTHNTTNHNSHNKTFNLQFFLNETCKDAMNIMDFVDSIKLQLSDLEKVGEIGYVEGISNIITSNLKALDITQRPIHCTDKKREVLYIKDENKWEKENDNKNKIRKAIKRVVIKNQKLLPKFKEAHPDCGKSDSAFSDQYNNIIIESMGGKGNNDREKEEKIIKNITNCVTINKELY